jgi:hypothetical protein
MTAVNSTWLIGSFTLAANATIVINGNNAVISADTYYLRHATAGLGLIGVIQTALQVHVASVSVFIGKDRKLRITAGVALTLTIPASLQAVTGLIGSPAVGSTVSAASISTLLWSPSYPETSENPSGVTGRRTYDRVQTVSPTGYTTRTTTHHYTTVNQWSWFHVPQARAWTTDAGEPGEFWRWWLDVGNQGMRFQLYPGESLSEDSAVTTTVTWPTALGPYVASKADLKRTVPNMDEFWDVELSGHVVTELT